MVLFVDIDNFTQKSYNYCAVQNCCNSIENQNTKFYNFPNDFKLCEKWISQCNRTDNISPYHITENLKICEEHFDNSAYLFDDILKSTAIPTLRLNSPESSKFNYSPLAKFYENFLVYEEFSPDSDRYCENNLFNNNSIYLDNFSDVPDEILNIIIQSIVDMKFLSGEDVELALKFYESEINIDTTNNSYENGANNLYFSNYLNDKNINKINARELECNPTNIFDNDGKLIIE